MTQHVSDTSTKASLTNQQRNSKGHFAKGNTIAKGASGNPNPHNQFQPGNQAARKSGMFANFFPQPKQYMFELAKYATLKDELMLCRVMLQTNIELIEKLETEIKQVEEPELKHRMQDTLFNMEDSTVMWIARIESLTKTISRIGLVEALRKRERLKEQLAKFEETENR